MATDPYIVRFTVGCTYRLHTSRTLPSLCGGTLEVKAELKPRDQWGNRVLLADVRLAPKEGGKARELLGVRCFVEEGVSTRRNAYGPVSIPVEVATVPGLDPDRAKSYANEESHRGGFTPVPTKRVA